MSSNPSGETARIAEIERLAAKWSDPEFWKDEGCRMDSQDCAQELQRLLSRLSASPAPCVCHSGSICGPACEKGAHHDGCSRATPPADVGPTLEGELAAFGERLAAAHTDLPPEVMKVLNENRWDAYEYEPVKVADVGPQAQGITAPKDMIADYLSARFALIDSITPNEVNGILKEELAAARNELRLFADYLAKHTSAGTVSQAQEKA